jgi:hypothetical protein
MEAHLIAIYAVLVVAFLAPLIVIFTTPTVQKTKTVFFFHTFCFCVALACGLYLLGYYKEHPSPPPKELIEKELPDIALKESHGI